MMRGFRFRVFLLVVLVAVLTAGVVAGLVAWRVDQAAQATVETQRFTGDEIGAKLESFAGKRASWSQVDDKVAELHDETGERILLTNLSGDVIVDSAETKGESPPPSTQQPTLLRPRLTPQDVMELEYTPTPEAMSEIDDAVKELAEFRGQMRLVLCKEAFKDEEIEVESDADDGELDSPVTDIPECEGSEKVSASEEREDREAFDACADEESYDDRKTCLFYVMQQRALDVSPEPLLLHLGTEEPFTITYPATQLTILGLAVLIVVVLVSALLARRVIRPIDSLITASRALSSGNLKTKVSIRGRDELTELGNTFNQMVESLDRAERQRRQLIADSAHELRTPLSNIHGYLEAIADGIVPASPEHIDSLREESTLLARIIDDLRLLALSDAGQLPCERIPQDAAELLRGCQAAHQAAANGGQVNLTLDVPDTESLPIDVDPNRMRQAIGNLVTNALHATPADGTVALRAFASGDEVVLMVADTGGGIAPDHLSRVFDRFWRADSSRSRDTGGSGLGLAITRELVGANGGDITVRNGSRGAIFTITLPRSTSHPEAVSDT